MAFKFGQVKMDDRVYAMNLCKTMPLKYLMLCIYPNLYAIHNLDDRVKLFLLLSFLIENLKFVLKSLKKINFMYLNLF